MTTANQLNTGSNGSYPVAATGSFGAFSWVSYPAGNTSDIDVSSAQMWSGYKSLRPKASCTWAASYLLTPAPVYFGMPIYLGAALTADIAVAQIRGGGYANSNTIGITADRRVYLSVNQVGTVTNDTSGTVSRSSTNAVPLGQWCWIEGKLQNGNCTVRFYADASSSTLSFFAIDQPGGSIGTVDALYLGPQGWDGAAAYTSVATTGDLYLGPIFVDSAGFPGRIYTLDATPTATFTGSAGVGGSFTMEGSAAASFTATSQPTVVQSIGAAATATFAASAQPTAIAVIDAEATAVYNATGQTGGYFTASATATATASATATIYKDSDTAPGFLFGGIYPNPVTGG